MTAKQQQWQLYYLGYYKGELDGIWGTQSKDATLRFQRDNGLDADGIFGELTAAKSMDIIKSIQKEITDGKIAIDGLAGQETKDATVQWQAQNDLTPDGIAGPLTRERLFRHPSQAPDDWWDAIQYFSKKEFACKCRKYCDGYPTQMQREIVQIADRARTELGGPAYVSSGLRCPQHNANVGGVENSRHLTGKAVDLRVEGCSAQQTLAWAQAQTDIRYTYAIDESYVHMDIL